MPLASNPPSHCRQCRSPCKHLHRSLLRCPSCWCRSRQHQAVPELSRGACRIAFGSGHGCSSVVWPRTATGAAALIDAAAMLAARTVEKRAGGEPVGPDLGEGLLRGRLDPWVPQHSGPQLRNGLLIAQGSAPVQEPRRNRGHGRPSVDGGRPTVDGGRPDRLHHSLVPFAERAVLPLLRELVEPLEERWQEACVPQDLMLDVPCLLAQPAATFFNKDHVGNGRNRWSL
mmetsp:Transcript_5468/g.15822  ORF Transcript_5468/g.15822 Transcript_5468/m.15822 type:complete len:229 (+) Transcript_5468:66-752(+)